MKRGITVGKNSHSERNNITQRDQDSLGKFLQELPQPMSPEEEVQYVAAAKAGSIHARQMLIAYNARFIVSVAKDFQAKTGTTLPLSDLISQGVEGLNKAITVFDPILGNKLLTYAVWKIRAEMFLFDRNEGRLVRPPTTHIDLSKKIRNHINHVFVETGGVVSEDELAVHLEKTPKAVRKALIFMGSKSKSFDEPLGSDKDSDTMYDTYTMPDQLLPDAQVENKEMLGYVHRRVQKLPDIYKTIIIHSYGLYGSVIIPDQELADFLGYTIVRLRQLKKEACDMMLKLSQGKTPKKMSNTKKRDTAQLNIEFASQEQTVEQDAPEHHEVAQSNDHEIESTIPPRKSSEIPLAPDTLLNNMLMKYALPTIPKPVLVEFVQAAWEDACAMKDLCEDDVDFMLQAQAMIDAYMKSHVETVQRLLKEYEATFTTKTVGQPGQELDEEMPDMVFTSLAGRTFVKGHSQADAAAKEEAFQTLLGNLVPGNTNEYYPD